MAELTVLESKLAEVLGLAEAASGAGERVSNLVDDEEIRAQLERMRREAEETAERCTEVAEALDGKKTAVLEKARETKQEATEMMRTYLGDDADGLDGLEFLTMAEAGEVGHWEILGVLGEKAGNPEIEALVKWATPIQQRHFQTVREGSLQLARDEDPNETES
jgi:rubrerythrin